MRRGLTMVEALVALAVLGALTVALASWTQVTARGAVESAEPLRWRLAADAVCRLIHDDIVGGDRPEAERRRGEPPRVEVHDGKLVIETRAVGPARHRYVLDPFEHELRLERHGADGDLRERPLLDAVAEFRCVIDDEQDLLTVTIGHRDGPAVTRRYRLP